MLVAVLRMVQNALRKEVERLHFENNALSVEVAELPENDKLAVGAQWMYASAPISGLCTHPTSFRLRLAEYPTLK